MSARRLEFPKTLCISSERFDFVHARFSLQILTENENEKQKEKEKEKGKEEENELGVTHLGVAWKKGVPRVRVFLSPWNSRIEPDQGFHEVKLP